MMKDREWYHRNFNPNWPLQGYHIIAASWCEGSVLDIGSGTGRMKELIPDVVCLDFSDPAIEKTQGIKADAYHLPIKKVSFNTVLLLEILEHLKTPSSAFSEAIRVSKKLIIVAVPEKNEHLSVSHVHNIPLSDWIRFLDCSQVDLKERKMHDHRHILRWQKK